MRDFSKVSPLLWRDKSFRSLASSDARLLYLYCMTSEHQNSAGCYRIPDLYAASDLGWDPPRLLQAREEIVRAGLVQFDEDTSEIYIVDWFKTNPITNVKHYMGTLRLVLEIESDQIRELVEEAVSVSEQERQEKEAISLASVGRPRPSLAVR